MQKTLIHQSVVLCCVVGSLKVCYWLTRHSMVNFTTPGVFGRYYFLGIKGGVQWQSFIQLITQRGQKGLSSHRSFFFFFWRVGWLVYICELLR